MCVQSKGSTATTRRKGKSEIEIEIALEALQLEIDKEKELEQLLLDDPAVAKARLRTIEEKEAKETEKTIYGEQWDVAKRHASAKDFEKAKEMVMLCRIYICF